MHDVKELLARMQWFLRSIPSQYRLHPDAVQLYENLVMQGFIEMPVAAYASAYLAAAGVALSILADHEEPDAKWQPQVNWHPGQN